MSIGPSVVQAIPGFFEPISSLLHLGAAALGLFAAVPLVRLARGSGPRRAAVAVYAFCVIATLAISGTYHSLNGGGEARHFMRRLDYFAIWLLIAGTFTALHGVMHRGRWRSWMLAFIWSYAAAGCLLQVFRFEVFSGVAGLALYLGLGWVGLVSIIKLGRQIGFPAVRPIWYAGLFYSAGAILEATGHPTLIARWVGPHELFHVAVLAGVALHWMFIRELLLVHAPPWKIAPAPLALLAAEPLSALPVRRALP